MYILIGKKNVLKKIWAGKRWCPMCGEEHDFYLVRKVLKESVFFIPMISYTTGRYLVSDSCEYANKIKKSEFNSIKKKQLEKFKKGEFSEKDIRKYCHPECVDFATKIIKLILSVWFIILVPGSVSVSVVQFQDGNVAGAFIWLIMALICLMAFFASLRGFLLALKMRKAYNSLTGESILKNE